ncbi:maleylpyruvate isomerase family mycothiol-dependent enzyme [Kitasatospora sp. NPDC127111]|uniref:maleylpyruvate isomerase family mycothiol-dependent enzyme n=1 Tax=Kitasatospora sp. NPDC127111 TaxID=3345363 RepID=UPI00362F7B7F
MAIGHARPHAPAPAPHPRRPPRRTRPLRRPARRHPRCPHRRGATRPLRPSGWTRAHVVTHVALSADAYRRLLAVARTGAEPTPRSDAGLARAVAAGAARPAAELTADLHDSLAGLLADARSMPAEAWNATVTPLADRPHPAWFTLHRCWREPETHHTDQARRLRPGRLARRLRVLGPGRHPHRPGRPRLPAQPGRGPDLDRRWTLTPTGPAVTAPAHRLLAWLSGRADAGSPITTGPVPAPPAWPLPPTRPWSWT